MAHGNTGKGKGLAWIRANVTYSGDECLLWPFNKPNGYGMLSFNGAIHYAHRLMCEMVHGPQPSGNYHAAHECGNSGCVNPRHLSWKTVTDNQLDRARHGTKSTGCRSKLSQKDADAIRFFAGFKTQRELAEMFGVSRSQISWVVTGKSWPEKRQRRNLSQEELAEIRILVRQKKVKDIVAERGYDRSIIYRIRKNELSKGQQTK